MIDLDGIHTINPTDIPVPSESALQILHACNAENVNIDTLTKLVSVDPIVSTELLRIVNSAYMGMTRKIHSVSDAITLLGQKKLYNILLCIAVKKYVQTTQFTDAELRTIWCDLISHAVCARELALALNIDSQSCFSMGLFQDLGLLAQFTLTANLSINWSELRLYNPEQRYTLELSHFHITHTQLIDLLGVRWNLPQQWIKALSEHHKITSDQNTAVSTLSQILYCADWMSFIFCANDPQNADKRCRQILTRQFNLDETTQHRILNAIPEQIEQAAQAMGIGVNVPVAHQLLMQQTNAKLAEINLDFQLLTLELENALQQRNEIAEELKRELQLAREIQQGLFPENCDHKIPCFGINISAKELSGDFYDYFMHKNGKLYFCLGDVSGKGVNAALLMAKASSLFRCITKITPNLTTVMEVLNREIHDTAVRGMFVTMACGSYDPQSGDIHWVNAGNPPAILIKSNQKFTLIDAQSPPLGILPELEFHIEQTNLGNNSLYFYSDGLSETVQYNGKLLGSSALAKLLTAMRQISAPQRIETICKKLINGNPLRDDMTLLLIEGRQKNAEHPARL